MSETQKITLSTTSWTDASGAITSGSFTNNSHTEVRYRIADAQPSDDDNFGHVLPPQTQRSFTLTGSEKLWAKSITHEGKIALTPGATTSAIINANIVYEGTAGLDAIGRQKTSEPFGILENKNVSSRNRTQWNEVISGAILQYGTLIGGPFTAGEEIRGTGALLPIGTINTDNGSNSMNIDCNHNDFTVGMTITGQISGATAVLTSTNTGSDIQHDINRSSVKLTVGTGATDKAFRQSFRRAAYVPGRSVYPALTFLLAAQKTNVVQEAGMFEDEDGIFVRQTDSSIDFVIRSSVSGSPVETVYPQSSWNIDRLDGGASAGPNPSGATLDLTKPQYFAGPYLWQGVGPVEFGFMIGNNLVIAHSVETANLASAIYLKNPSLPIRFQIRNTGVTASATTMEEICTTVASEGGYQLPGLDFAASSGITDRTVDDASMQPIFAIRLKQNFPSGENNRRTVRLVRSALLGATEDSYFEVRHVHEPVDITATWNDVGPDSAVEYSIDITAYTGRNDQVVEADWLPTTQGNKPATQQFSAEFLSEHAYISLNHDNSNSEMFVILAQSLRVTDADIRSGLIWIEFD